MQGSGRHIRQRRVPQVPAPMLRERGGLGAQGVSQRRGGRGGDQGPARPARPGAAVAQLEARQSVRGDCVVNAQPCQGDSRVVDM